MKFIELFYINNKSYGLFIHGSVTPSSCKKEKATFDANFPVLQ